MSIFIGGFVIGRSHLAILKLGTESERFAWSADLTRDDVTESWPSDGSRGTYVAWAGAFGVRRYRQPAGRGLFAELGAAAARPRLAVQRSTGVVTARETWLGIAVLGAGGRWGQRPRGLFGEVGLRAGVPLQTRHLYTDPVPPVDSREDGVTYHSWYFGRGQASAQLYLGLGYSL